MSMHHVHPELDRPPVVEVALAAEFTPLGGLDIPKIVLFWQTMLQEYTIFQVQPPIVSPGTALIGIAGAPPMRCWFINELESRLVQIQHDRIIYNWRRTTVAEEYPHYSSVRDAFISTWDRFWTFLESQNLAAPEVQQVEVTYIDHIELQPQTSLGDISPLFAGALEAFLPGTALVNFNTAFLLPDSGGILNLGITSARRNADSQPLYEMTSTARIPTASGTVADIQTALDRGHQVDVDAFLQFTSAKLQTSWGRRE